MIRNKVILIGRLTKDVELRRAGENISVANFSIAVDKPYKKDREHPEAIFVNCTAWRGQADFLSKHFSKGDKVAVEGYLDDNVWTDKDGKERRDKFVMVSEIEFVERKKDKINAVSGATKDVANSQTEDDDEDLPF